MIASAEKPTRLSSGALGRLTEWQTSELRHHARGEVLSAIVKLLFAVIALVVIEVLFLGVLGRFFVRYDSAAFIVLIPVAAVLAALVAQAFRYRSQHGVMQVHGQRVHYADQRTHFGAPDEGVDFLAVVLFPGWLFFSAVESLAIARRLRRAHPEMCARVLASLAIEDKRVFIPDLEQRFGPNLVPTLRALVAVPGVMITSRETPALLLSPELGAQIRDML